MDMNEDSERPFVVLVRGEGTQQGSAQSAQQPDCLCWNPESGPWVFHQ